MVCTCLYSKFVEFAAISDTSAANAAQALIQTIYYRHGAPRCILSDWGSNFTSRIFRELCKEFKIEQRYTTSWHPMTNGGCEQSNNSLIQMIRLYINDAHDDWEDLLEPLRFGYCN